MYTLYIANKNYSSWSLRPWLLLKALNIPFTEVLLPFGSSTWKQNESALPSGKVPALVDGEISVWDSLAIIEHIAEINKNVWPTDKSARAWARSATAEMHSSFQTLRNICSMNCGVRVKLNEISADLKKDISRFEELWSQGLDKFGGPFLAGDKFTAADAFYAPVVFRIQTYGLPVSAKTRGYMNTLLELPAMKEWYQDGLNETFRDPGHDAEMMKHGTVIEDLRKGAN